MIEDSYNRDEYSRGWHYAARVQRTEYANHPYRVKDDDDRAPEWFDGFFDRSAGRPKWYIPTNLDRYTATGGGDSDNERFIRRG